MGFSSPLYSSHYNLVGGETAGFLPLLLALAILVAGAKLAGALAVKLGQPAVLGELLAGLLLGPTALDMFHLPFLEDPSGVTETTISQLAQLGVIFLMFSAGLVINVLDPDVIVLGGGLSQLRRLYENVPRLWGAHVF